jgi:hypothetical protein
MLQMNCPKCNGVIKSPFLAELSSIECSECNDNVPVKDVFVTTKSFTIHRDDLLNRIFRYQSLLKEVEKERSLLMDGKEISEATRKSIDQFSTILQELLVGARKNFRLDLPYELCVTIDTGNSTCNGKLVNLSSEGASIKFDNLDELPKARSSIKLSLQLPETDEVLSLTAKIAWNKKSAGAGYELGVSFLKLDESTRSIIWNFIMATASVSLPGHSLVAGSAKT